MFCNMYEAYEGLSVGLRTQLNGMRAMHSAKQLVQEVPNRLSVNVAPPAVPHPVVRTHPYWPQSSIRQSALHDQL